MQVPVKLLNKTIMISPYTTSQEKDILLWASYGEQELDDVFKILGLDISKYNLSDDEKKVLLYKYREISLGDEIQVSFTCDDCGFVNESAIEGNNFIIESKRDDDDIKKLTTPVTDETLHEFVNVDVDELDIDEFEALKDRVKENQSIIDFDKECTCMRCQSVKKFDNLGDKEFIFEIMSEDTLMTLYKTYNHLTFFGNYTKLDIDSMYPFERSVFVGLLNKTKEDLNT